MAHGRNLLRNRSVVPIWLRDLDDDKLHLQFGTNLGNDPIFAISEALILIYRKLFLFDAMYSFQWN